MMLRQFIFLLPVFIAGVILGAWAREPSPPTSPQAVRDFDHAADYERLEHMISSLTEIVDLEVAERRRLEEMIATLTEQVAALAGNTANSTADSRQAAAAVRIGPADLAAARGRRNANEINIDRFVDAGFPPDVATRIKRDLDQVALDRLFLRDQAVREGWLNSSRYRDELRQLNERQKAIYDELSPEDHDRYLYAMGRPNRVVVSSVLSGSPADQAGLQAGDAILSYNGSRVFSPSEIRRETSRGDAGSMVPVQIMRDGQSQIIYLPRGPLGVNMSASSTKP